MFKNGPNGPKRPKKAYQILLAMEMHRDFEQIVFHPSDSDPSKFDIDDNVTDVSETSEETSLGSELDVTEKTQDEIDFQLSRALDLIRGASVFSNLKK